MKYLDKKQQLRNEIKGVESSLEWQKDRVHSTHKRYDRKAFGSLFSLFIFQDSSTLLFIYEKEYKIQKNLESYLDTLQKRLMDAV